MTHSPGHEKWPEHKVEEKHLTERVQVLFMGDVLAESYGVIQVDEDKHPPRFYVPRKDVDMTKLSPSNKTSECPFKGKAHYFNLNFDVKELQDAAWTYEEPYEEHRDLKDRIAFYDELPDIDVKRL